MLDTHTHRIVLLLHLKLRRAPEPILALELLSFKADVPDADLSRRPVGTQRVTQRIITYSLH